MIAIQYILWVFFISRICIFEDITKRAVLMISRDKKCHCHCWVLVLDVWSTFFLLIFGRKPYFKCWTLGLSELLLLLEILSGCQAIYSFRLNFFFVSIKLFRVIIHSTVADCIVPKCMPPLLFSKTMWLQPVQMDLKFTFQDQINIHSGFECLWAKQSKLFFVQKWISWHLFV